jgi:phage terminase large subunit-like protein
MTINKSQGQTIDYVGLDLEKDVFSHGVTYVAVSRVRTWDSLKVKVNPDADGKIKNIVWKEVLLEQNEDEPNENMEVEEEIVNEPIENHEAVDDHE